MVAAAMDLDLIVLDSLILKGLLCRPQPLPLTLQRASLKLWGYHTAAEGLSLRMSLQDWTLKMEAILYVIKYSNPHTQIIRGSFNVSKGKIYNTISQHYHYCSSLECFAIFTYTKRNCSNVEIFNVHSYLAFLRP